MEKITLILKANYKRKNLLLSKNLLEERKRKNLVVFNFNSSFYVRGKSLRVR